ncbi:MAG: hypothetical protein V3V40_03440 [Nitrosomonadaceae bacterium]
MSYRLPLVLLAGLFLSTPISAEKPDGFGKDKSHKQSQKHKNRAYDGENYQQGKGSSVTLNAYFDDHQLGSQYHRVLEKR